MKNKYFYPIFKLKVKSWIRYWLLKKTEFKGKLSEILEGFSFNLQNTLRQKFVKFEIEGNSIQDGEPSPENEVPILSSGENGSITEKIVNGNLWSSEWIQGNYSVLDGKWASTSNIICTKDFIKVPTNKVLTISRTVYTNYIQMRYYDKNKEYLGQDFVGIKELIAGNSKSNPMNKQSYCTLIFNEEVSYLKINDLSNDLSTKYQMEYGNQVTSYHEHEEQTYTIPTQQPFRSIGDVRDCFVKVNGEWKERHIIRKNILKNIENWEDRPNYTYADRFVCGLKRVGVTHSGYSNYFVVKTLATNTYPYIDNNSNQVVVNFSEKGTTTLEQFKTWLTTHNIELYSIDTEPTDLPCTAEQTNILENLPITYEGQTNVYSTDVVEPHLKIQYWESDTNG